MAPNTFIWVASRAIHILAVIFWLGGSLFLALALMPVLRSQVDREACVPLVSQVGRRFSRITWVLMALLIATGLVNMWSMNFLPDHFFNTSRGAVLLIKLILFGLILALSVVHDSWLGPRLDELATAGKVHTMEYARQRKRSVWLARLNVLLGVIVVVLILVFRVTYT